MSFLFPSLIRLSRPQGITGAGAQPYSGLSQAKETVIVTAAKAHIQPDRQGQAPLSGLPADAAGQPTVKIILKLPKGIVQRRDVLTDDLGSRYQAIQAVWTPLGTTVLAVTLNGPGQPAVMLAFPDAPWELTAGNWESLTTPWAPATPWGAQTANWETTNTKWESMG